MYVKRNLCPGQYYKRTSSNKWYCLDKYGDKISDSYVSDTYIIDSLVEASVTVVENPTFEKKVIWPRVFTNGGQIRIYNDATSPSLFFTSNFKLCGPIGNDSFNRRKENGLGTELFGDERMKLLNVLEVLKRFPG